MSGAWIRSRERATGKSYAVCYRRGGRDTRVEYAGTFRSLRLAEQLLDEVRGDLAKCIRPDQAMRRVGFVYYGQLGGLVKIGFSLNPERRCQHLGLTILAVERGGRAREREVHMAFASDRIRGEWFEPSKRLLRFIERVARQVAA